MVTILDGTGSGNEAAVDKNNRLQVLAISEGYSIEAAIQGENYNLNTGSISLTSSNKSAVFYLKNNEDKAFIIEDIIVILGASTGGTGDLVVDVVRNPSTGTIISNAVDVDIVANRNFGSNRPLTADSYKGVEGDTITDGSDFADTTRSSAGTVIHFDSDVIILPKGSSIGINITPQASNTSMNVKIAIVGYLVQ
jgi:hypothetical protein